MTIKNIINSHAYKPPKASFDPFLLKAGVLQYTITPDMVCGGNDDKHNYIDAVVCIVGFIL